MECQLIEIAKGILLISAKVAENFVSPEYT